MTKTLEMIGELISSAGDDVRNWNSWGLSKVIGELRQLQNQALEESKLNQELVQTLSMATKFIDDARMKSHCEEILKKCGRN